MSHVNLNDLDLSKLKIGKSGRMVKLMYNKEPLQLVTCKLYTPFGAKVVSNNYSNFSNCYIDCSLNQSNSDSSVKYQVLLEDLDNRIKELIKESVHLFNTDSEANAEQSVELNYKPILKENKTYPKLMKITLPRDTKGNFDFVIFDENKEKVTITDNNIETILHKGKVFKGIIECGKIWYYKDNFGTTWNLKQMKFAEREITKNETSKSGNDTCTYMMIDE